MGTKISEMPVATAVQPADIFHLVQDGVNKQVPSSTLEQGAALNKLARNTLWNDANEARMSDDAYHDLTIDTPVAGNNEVAHPSVLFIEEGFGQGHHWWMAITPLPIGQGGDYETHENPCIYNSLDGKNWAAPAGLTNPIAPDPDPGGTGHNADTALFLSPDRRTMYCAWVELGVNSVTERVVVKSSTDGVVWSAPVTLLSVTASAERVLSPQINWDPVAGVWVMHVVDVTQNPNVMNYCTRADLNGAFGARTQCTYVLPPGETDPWHMDIRRLSTGRWFGLMGTDPSGGEHPQYPMDSADGITWRFGQRLSQRLGYKSAFVPIDSGFGVMYWGFADDPDWHVEMVGLKYDRTIFDSLRSVYEEAAGRGSAGKIGRYYAEDSFQRPNEAPIATSDSGDSWVSVDGQHNVVSNQMVAAAAQNNITVFNVGFADADIVVDFSNLSGSFGYVALRVADSNNFQRVGVFNAGLNFQRVGGAGGTEVLRSIGMRTSSTRRVRIVVSGPLYSIYADEKFVFQISDQDHITNTQFGVQSSDIVTTIDKVIVAKLG